MTIGKPGAGAVGLLLRLKAEHGPRFVRFCAVGAVNTSIDLAIFSALFYLAGWGLIAANSTSYVVAASNSYLLNKHWTFRDPSRGREAWIRAGRFIVLNTIGIGLANLALWALAHFLPVIIAKLASIGISVLWNYNASSRLVYR